MESVIEEKQILRAESEIQIVSEQTDDALVGAVLAGDEAAFKLIFERYRRLIAHLVSRFFYDRAEVEELMQQSFTKIYFSLDSFQGGREKSFSSWISKITVNQCYNELRRQKRHPENRFGDLTEEEIVTLERAVTKTDSIGAEDSLINRDLSKKLLSKLEAPDRLALTLLYAEEMSIEEVSEILGWSPSNVKTRLFRARNYLRNVFKTSK
jgi:RNA polymerase sigma-70 factor (ECF subfamily)